MRIGVLTGGGDVPGLNAAIRAVVRRAYEYNFEVLAIRNGWEGLVLGNIEPMSIRAVSGILPIGGTILGSSRTNPFKREEDVEKSLGNIDKFGLDALVVIGGDDTLGVGARFSQKGVKVVGVPKTIDNDVYGTDYCIGFDTAVSFVAEALDRLHTTASSHHRVIVVEVMGRHAGWVAVVGGMAGGADYIMIPEVETSIDEVCDHVRSRWARGKNFSIVVVAEGAKVREVTYSEEELGEKDEFGHVRLDRRGLAYTLNTEIERRTGFEARSVVLGHLQRGGSPTAFDRVLATRFGVFAVDMLKEGLSGNIAALQGNSVVPFPISEVLSNSRPVDVELYEMAKVFF